jgi:hypothetical protein
LRFFYSLILFCVSINLNFKYSSGGASDDDFLNELFYFDLVVLNWTEVRNNLPFPSPRAYFSIDTLGLSLYIYGGVNQFNSLVSTCKMYLYACLYVCMYVYMYLCMHICIYVCIYVCMHFCMYASFYRFMSPIYLPRPTVSHCAYFAYTFSTSDDLWKGDLVLNSAGADFSDMVWSKINLTSLNNPVARAYHAGRAALSSLFIHGGCAAELSPIYNDVWKFVPVSSAWVSISPTSSTGVLPVGRYGHQWGVLVFVASFPLLVFVSNERFNVIVIRFL